MALAHSFPVGTKQREREMAEANKSHSFILPLHELKHLLTLIMQLSL